MASKPQPKEASVAEPERPKDEPHESSSMDDERYRPYGDKERATLIGLVKPGSMAREDFVATVSKAVEAGIHTASGGKWMKLAYAIFGEPVRGRGRETEQIRAVVGSMLERLFDPQLRFKMRYTDIAEAFQAHCLPGSCLTSDVVKALYISVLNRLTSGELKTSVWQHHLGRYLDLKVEEVTWSRQEWELH